MTPWGEDRQESDLQKLGAVWSLMSRSIMGAGDALLEPDLGRTQAHGGGELLALLWHLQSSLFPSSQ